MMQDAQAQPEPIQAQPKPSVDPALPSLPQLFEALDPRTVAGGFLGLVTGEAIGGTIGGMVGGVFLGPAGMVAGAGIGAFTGSMIGQKVGSDTIADLVKVQEMPLAETVEALPNADQRLGQVSDFLSYRIGERAGEVVGIAAGSTVGMVVAGPIGGAVGATLGATLGGKLGEDWIASVKGMPELSSAQWLQKFGATTVGEAGTAVMGAAVGTAFLGVPGKRLGERIGTIVGKRIEWHTLVLSESPPVPVARTAESISTAYTIVHRVRGYIRFRIPQLRGNAAWAEQFQKTAEAWTGVTQVRISLAASSIAITYDSAQTTEATLEREIKLVLTADD